MQETTVQKVADISSALLSQLCLIHCLFLPILLSVLPSVSVPGFVEAKSFHLVVLSAATPVALFALYRGFAKHHSRRPLSLGLSALVMLWAVFFCEELVSHDLVAAFNVTGGLLMAWAHWQNWTLTHDHSDDCAYH